MSETSKQRKYPKYWKDDRSDTEKTITQKLAEKLSEINHARRKRQVTFTNKNHLFITVGGVPPNQNEFIGLEFPGKVINYRPPFFEPESHQKLDEQTLKKRLFNVSMESTCEQINKIIEKSGFKDAIFVYHSFGGSIVAFFCSKHPQKIKGLISIGGVPIRFYPIMKDYTKAYMRFPNLTREFIFENYEVFYSIYYEKTKNHKSWTMFKNKQELLSFILHNDINTLHTLFDKVREQPLPILMIYGSHDKVITKSPCAETMVFMSYQHKDMLKPNKKLEQMSQRFRELNSIQKESHKTKYFNLQQKFVYFIHGGHSIHIIPQNNRIMQKLIDEYLYIILGGGTFVNELKQIEKLQLKVRSKL